MLATGLTLPTLFDDEAGIVDVLAGLRGTDSTMCVCISGTDVLRPSQQSDICWRVNAMIEALLLVQVPFKAPVVVVAVGKRTCLD